MKKSLATSVSALLLIGLTAGFAPAANAAPENSTSVGRIIAQDQTQQLSAAATAPREITVRTQPGAQVSIQPATASKANKKVTKRADDEGIAVFGSLTAGREYTVSSEGETVTALPVKPVGKAFGLTARTTESPESVDLTWQHKATPARGGDSITYEVQARQISPKTGEVDQTKAPVTQDTADTQATLTGLDPAAIYEFQVRAHNELGLGKPSIARMSEPLSALVQAPEAAAIPTQNPEPKNTSPAPKPAPAPAPRPAPAPKPNTRTIWVCPSGYQDIGANCQKTAAYTYTTQEYTFHDEVQTKAYTFHTETTGPAPIINEFSTDNICPAGYNLEDYGAQGKLCRQYGPVPTKQVKDAAPSGWTDNGSAYERTVTVKDDAPAGFTDNGSEWTKKDAAPSGWSDDGTQYVHTVAKQARVVPA